MTRIVPWRTSVLVAFALLSSPAWAQEFEGRFDVEGRPWFGGTGFEVELTITKDNGTYRVEHAFKGERAVLSGVGYPSGSDSLWVEFKRASGAAGRLRDLHTDGNGRSPESFQALYRFDAERETLNGWLHLSDPAGSATWLREDGTRQGDGRDGLHGLDPNDGRFSIPDRATFEAMARRDNVPGAMGVREIKFLVTDVNTGSPTLYFINTQTHEAHYYFARDGLKIGLTNAEFNAKTYFTDNREFIAGSIIAHDNFEHPDSGLGIYTVEFWPTDPVKVPQVDVAYKRVVAGMPFAADKIYYHAAGETQKALYRAEKAEFDRREIKVVGTEELFANVTYSPLNLGEGYGRLRLVDNSDPRPVSIREVVIFVSLPNDLSHVAGVISEAPQTPLSHINLKAKQNDTPNAFIKNASRLPEVVALLDEWVHYQVTPDGFVLEPATQAEVDAHFEAIRPADPQIPVRDLTVTEVRPLSTIGNDATSSVGAKAANLAELRKILPDGMVPSGYAIPFSFYDRFMRENGLYAEAQRMMADPAFQQDPAVREVRLRAFRRRIRRADMPADMRAEIGRIQDLFPADQPIRARSSTNNEDLEGFNGAGLYDSNTHRPDEGHLERTVKQVWRSLWNYRAFEEREFYRIDHMQAAMGVLLHPNFDEERANGVAVTKNIYDPLWPGFYVNVQAGESLVTNPDAGATPDEFLIARLGPNGEYEQQYVQHSNQLPQGQQTVLTRTQVNEFVRQMERIQSHFARLYERQDDPTFAMDIEFKTDASGRLIIKQARPWVD